MQSRGEGGVLQMQQITQAKGLLQFNSRGLIISPGGSQGICFHCVRVGYELTVLVTAFSPDYPLA